MKKLIRLFIVLIALTMTTGLSAQSFGVKAGLNLSNMLVKDNTETYSKNFDMKPGFHVGASAEFPLSEIISFEAGLLLSTKGYKMNYEETFFGMTVKLEGRTNLLYLDIPLTAKASFDLGGAKLYGAVGPYIGVGISGNQKIETTFLGQSEKFEEDIDWGNDELKSNLKRLDYGLIAGVGVQINAIQIGASYGFGLANISPYSSNGYKASNRVISVSVGYRFGGE